MLGDSRSARLDLDGTKARLNAAQRAIRGKNNASAERSLAAIRSDLFHGNSAADVPLLTPRRDLVLAQAELAGNRLTTASAELTEASASRRRYSSVGHAAAARQLAEDIHKEFLQ
jgi:autotransporter translocation and assembly factor TamB